MNERIRTKQASNILGITTGQLLRMAGQGNIPGAAKIGGTWTFDEKKIRKFIHERELQCQRKISSYGTEYGGSLLPYEQGSTDTAYIRAISKLRGKPETKESKRLRP